MGSKDTGLTKAEKRWRRQVREREAARAELEKEAAAAGQTPDEFAAMQRFSKEVHAASGASAIPHAVFTNAEKMYGVKLSEALLHVCAPILEEAADDPDMIEKGIMLGIIGWNMAVSPDADFKGILKTIKRYSGRSDKDAAARMMRQALDIIVKRKKDLYPKINLLIIKHEVVFSRTGLQVNVVGVAQAPNGGEISQQAARPEFFGRIGQLLSRRKAQPGNA